MLALVAPRGGLRAAGRPDFARPIRPTSWSSTPPRAGVVVEMRPEIAPLAVRADQDPDPARLLRRGFVLPAALKGYMAQTGDKGARTFRSDLPDLKAEFAFRVMPQTPVTRIATPAGEVDFIGSGARADRAGRPRLGRCSAPGPRPCRTTRTPTPPTASSS
ncbi:MAG: hypothetical protein WDM92_14650 [Caulobacteraceae bacterium]